MSYVSDIKSILEPVFDIPFSVKVDYRQQEPNIYVAPAENHDQLFSVHIYFHNQIRMEMHFEPQKYAAEMVRGMGNANEEKRKLFCTYIAQIEEKGAKTALKVNDVPQSIHDYNQWPEKWEKVSFKITVRPIETNQEDQPDYSSTIQKWLPLMMGLSLSMLNVEKKEQDERIGRAEGRKLDVTTTHYERNPVNRVLCLAKYGYACQICGFNFEKTYGLIGKEFIHVHHKVPVSQMDDGHIVDPLTELIPVCPNCHAMLHRENPPITPERLKQLITENTNKND